MRAALLLLCLLVAIQAPAPLPGAGAIAPPDGIHAQATYPHLANLTVVLEIDSTFLSPGVTQEDLVVFDSRFLRFSDCYPCTDHRIPTYLPPDMEGCLVGGGSRDEIHLCIEDRPGLVQTLPLGEVDELGAALFVWGDGCVIHRQDGLPPQKVSFQGLVIPAALAHIGPDCDTDS